MRLGFNSPFLSTEDTKSMVRRIVVRALTVFFGLLFGLCLAEVALRTAAHFVPFMKSTPFRQYDPVLGLTLLPHQKAFYDRGCFEGFVETNSWGWRDRERSLEKRPGEFRIALLGDSQVEAAQVKPDEVLNIRMEKLLQQKGYTNIEVLGFGVEGMGTTQELLMYETRVRQFHPDLVILMWIDNDVMNNSSTIQPKAYGIHTWYSPYYDLQPDGSLVLRPVESRPWNKFRSFFEYHSRLVYYAERVWQGSVSFGEAKWEGVSLQLAVYGYPPDPEWERAWVITEKVMARFAETVANDHAKLVVMPRPVFSPEVFDPDWRARVEKELGTVPPTFNPLKVNDRLREIGERNRIDIEFLDAYFDAYRDAHNLQWPYFSFPCDRHLSPLGHEVAAEAMVKLLEEHQLLPPRVQVQ